MACFAALLLSCTSIHAGGAGGMSAICPFCGKKYIVGTGHKCPPRK